MFFWSICVQKIGKFEFSRGIRYFWKYIYDEMGICMLSTSHEIARKAYLLNVLFLVDKKYFIECCLNIKIGVGFFKNYVFIK